MATDISCHAIRNKITTSRWTQTGSTSYTAPKRAVPLSPFAATPPGPPSIYSWFVAITLTFQWLKLYEWKREKSWAGRTFLRDQYGSITSSLFPSTSTRPHFFTHAHGGIFSDRRWKKKEIFSSSSSSSSRSETRSHGLIGHMKPRLWLSTQLLLDCFLSISAFLKLIFVWFPSYFIFYRKEKTTTKKQAFCVSKTINRLKLCRMRRWRGAHQILWQDDPSLLLLLLFFLLLSTPYHHLFS